MKTIDYNKLSKNLNEDLTQFYDEAFAGKHNYILNNIRDVKERYTELKLIGEGGSKKVFKARDCFVNRYVAYASVSGNDEAAFESFLREARLTALLIHPNIITILDMGLNKNGRPFFTMELKVGESLTEIIKNHNKNKNSNQDEPSLNNLLEIFLKICDAVAYAHSQNIIHLDLKPENIQVGKFGEVVLCDWGLGKMVGDADSSPLKCASKVYSNTTLHGVIKGTPGYMAPEQVSGEEEKDQQTDIYALGAILYSLLTGAPPVNGSDTDEILEKTVDGIITPPKAISHNIPAALSAVTMKALEKDKEKRYGSAEELKSEIVSFLRGFATTAEEPGFIKQLHLFYKRNRRVCNVLFSAIILYLLSSLLFMDILNQSRLKAEKMQIIAEKQKNIAEQTLIMEKKARTEAENNLNLYFKQKNLANLYINQLQNSYSRFFNKDFFMPHTTLTTFNMMWNTAKLMAIKNPDDKRSLHLFGKYQFYKGNFTEALKLLDYRRPGMIKVSRIMIKKHLTRHKLKLTSYKTLFDNIVTKKVKNSNEHILRFVRFADLKRRTDIADIIKIAMQSINPKISQIEWIPESSTLKIKTQGQHIIIPEKEEFSLLTPLKPENIIISGTDHNLNNFPKKLRNKIKFAQ
jgi:serine/threonine-protein kinase